MDNPFEKIFSQLEGISGQMSALTKQINHQEKLPEDNPTQYLTTQDVCQLLRISRVTLWNWEKKGIVHPIHLGSLKRYRKQDVLNIGK